MANVQVLEKKAEIDGRPVNWKVLGITGYINGEFQTLEVKLNKTEAMLANMLLKSDENPEVHTSKGGSVDVKKSRDTEPEIVESWLD